jgi:hypothetical protein
MTLVCLLAQQALTLSTSQDNDEVAVDVLVRLAGGNHAALDQAIKAASPSTSTNRLGRPSGPAPSACSRSPSTPRPAPSHLGTGNQAR